MKEAGMKQCKRCGEWKPFTDYNGMERSSDGLRTMCKPCVSAVAQEWYYAHHEYAKKRNLDYYYNVLKPRKEGK